MLKRIVKYAGRNGNDLQTRAPALGGRRDGI
jgi:hypothetical protein